MDLRNHGQSEWSEHNTLHDYEADLEHFLSENQMNKCILIGHSLGGKIAMFFALRKVRENIIISYRKTSLHNKKLLPLCKQIFKNTCPRATLRNGFNSFLQKILLLLFIL